MAFQVLAEGLLRIEHKLDQLLHALAIKGMGMQFFGNSCPICDRPVEYQIDMTHNVVRRKCGCSSGKQPSTIPLTELVGGNDGREDRTAEPADDSRRQRRSR